ncbi:hypothetical protein, partial [Salmonella sp. SAL04281]|uniref:hypothetical protein n=1 Tax=Salmonella sp. SAL04281 TaxID=3159859 RepID=UPI00397D1533
PKSDSGAQNPASGLPRLEGQPASESKPEESKSGESKPGDAADKPSADSKESSDAEPHQGEQKSPATPAVEKNDGGKKSDPESR